ncbi:MAG TPA: MBL fold metallo-hydrolase [Thermoanaerobaculia bacterium]|jgi:competence protein ComEC|nr:MBL fold metallo-hydrolase [Thermoanaerobaculia bacterium]
MGKVKSAAILTVVDVGHGNATIVTSGDQVVMIDVGGRNSTLEYCRREGITSIDCILISHADADHIGGLLALLSNTDIHLRLVRLNPDATKGSELWNDLLWELDNARERGEIDFRPSLTVADDGEFDIEGIRFEIAAPSVHLAGKAAGSRSQSKQRITTNTLSVVVRVCGKTRAVLVCGDLDDAGLNDIVAHAKDLQAAVLIFPHHGGGSGSDASVFTDRLLRLVRPELVIFSIGRNQKPSTPRVEIVEAIRSASVPIRIACTQLSVQCAPVTPATDAKHLVDSYARGRLARGCCGGSMRISLDQMAISPSADSHGAFIDEFAPTALCRRPFDN